MNPQVMPYGPAGPAGYPPSQLPPIATQMQGMSLNQQSGQDPYRRPPQAANGAPGGAPTVSHTNGPPQSHQNYRPPQNSAPTQYNTQGPAPTQTYPPGVKPATPQNYPSSPQLHQAPHTVLNQATTPQPGYPNQLYASKPQNNLPPGPGPQSFPSPGQPPAQNFPVPAQAQYGAQGPPQNAGLPPLQTGQGSQPAAQRAPPQAYPSGGQSYPSGTTHGGPPKSYPGGAPLPGGPPQAYPGGPPPSTGSQTYTSGPPKGYPGGSTPQGYPGGPPPSTGPPSGVSQSAGPPQTYPGGAYPGGPPPPTGPLQGYPGGATATSPPQGYPPSGAPPSSAQFPQPSYGGQVGYPPGPQSPQGFPARPAGPGAPGAAGYPPQQANMYPPQPGYPPQGGQYGPQKQQYPQQESRRIEPDQLPSVIQVMQDDEKAHSGTFVTNQKGLMPPLMTTDFTVQDGGNASPRFIRSTLYSVPATTELMKQTAVPFAIIISPLARLVEGEVPPPVVDMGELGPVRCIRCKAYMCPFMQFIDGGRRFHCLLCKATTEVPAEYFQHLDQTGLRTDRFSRPELILGAYEFVATKEYCRNSVYPKPPALVFIIDVSYNNVRSGLLHLICARMKEVLRSVPLGMRVGFVTYSSSVHFYNIKSCLAAPQMVIVGDVQEMFMPLLDGFLADPRESETVIDQLMEEIPRQFADTRETETILLPAIQAGLEALKAAECAGKLLVFHSSLPIAEAPGKLKNRDDRKLLGSEKEKTVLAPQDRVYNELGQNCVAAGVGVDLFAFNNAYIDLATIGQVSRLTGGEVFKYTYFQADLDGDRFIEDLKTDVSRETAYDAIMRVRTSTGTRPTEFYGHLFMQNTTDIEIATIDSDKAIAVEIKHDDKLVEEDGVYIQVALLYTHVTGQRRLRVLNLSLKACSQMADMYRCADLDTLINFFAKQGVTKLLEVTPKQVKENLMTRCATTLACYRKHCASPSGMGQLILPECMKLLPLYVNTLLKSDALAGGSDMTVDDRSFAMYAVLVMDINLSIVYFYPRLVPLHLDDNSPIRCSLERLQENGIYLLDNGIYMFLWVGLKAPPELISALFGVSTFGQIDSDRPTLPALENQFSEEVRGLVAETRRLRHRFMRLTIVKQHDKLELVMKHFLMEDTGVDGSPSYVDFLCHMHKEIRNLLS